MSQRLLLAFLGVCLWLLADVSAAQETETDTASVPLFVAALGRNSSTWSIVMLDPQAGGPERLTNDQYDEILPLPSADGRYVAFLRGHFETDDPLEYYVLDRDCLPECEPRRLPDGAQGLRDLRWSPIAPQLVGWGVDNALWLVDIEEDTVEQIIGGKWNAYPAWSPDGAMIVMSSDVVPEDAVLSDDIQVIPAQWWTLRQMTASI
jgi:Tol biopolymer transport system component